MHTATHTVNTLPDDDDDVGSTSHCSTKATHRQTVWRWPSKLLEAKILFPVLLETAEQALMAVVNMVTTIAIIWC